MILILTTSTSFTMPRLTRDQQFNDSFREFMASVNNNYPDLDQWTTVSKTINKSSSIHRYELKIPNNTFEYNIDAYTDRQGVHHPAVVTTGETNMPSTQELSSLFKNYFGKFFLKNRDSLLSYTALTDVSKNDTGDLSANIVVCYYKSHIPYPSKNKTFEQLKEQCDKLEKEHEIFLETANYWHSMYIKQEKDNKKLKNKMNKMQVDSVLEMRETVHKMQGKIREFYEKDSSKEDCPVCYECIESQQLMVPKCCHYICGGCYDRCDSCPMCRVSY